MSEVKDYKMICASYVGSFDKEVNDYLSKGWELHGTPFAIHSEGDGGFCQAVVMKNKEASNE